MAKSVLDILIKLSKQGNADKETITGLVKLKSSFMDAAAVAGTLVAAGYAVKKVFDATVGTMVQYADQVRTTSRATQLGAEESSRLIQMTDDLGVSYEGLEKAIKSSSDTTDFSIAGLMKTSEEYLKITDAQERAKFAQKQYGKAWIEMVGVLEKGPDAIRAASDAIADNLILTDEAVRQARQYEIALDNVNDSWTGLTVTAGSKGLPMLNTILLAVQKNIDAGISWRDAIAPVALFDTIKSLVQSHKELNPVIDSATQSYMAWGDSLQFAAGASEDVKRANDDQLALIFQLSDAYAMNAEAHAERTRKILLDMTLEKIAMLDGEKGFSDAEMAKALAVAETAGAVEAAAIRELVAMEGISGAIANGTIAAKDMKMILESLTTHGWTVQVAIQMQNLQNLRDVLAANSAANPGRTYLSGGRAAGGPVSANSMYVVGEEGPELFVPNQSGTIIPNGGGAGSGGGRGAASSIVVNLSMNSVVSMADRESMKRLTPFIIDGIREAQAQGYIK